MKELKYVIFKDGGAILVGELTQPSQVIDNIDNVASAGICCISYSEIMREYTVRCNPFSVSIDIKCNPEADRLIIRRMINFM